MPLDERDGEREVVANVRKVARARDRVTTDRPTAETKPGFPIGNKNITLEGL
jgi:hypothetical protein